MDAGGSSEDGRPEDTLGVPAKRAVPSSPAKAYFWAVRLGESGARLSRSFGLAILGTQRVAIPAQHDGISLDEIKRLK